MYLKLDTQFNPFTYDEMVKPLLYYKEAYDKAEAAYADLAQQTEAFENMVNREKSPIAYEMFKRYSGQLNNAVADFSNGMNSRNRKELIRLRKNYSKDILPIAAAEKRRETLADEQRKMRSSDPTIMFQRNAGNMSLDDFILDPAADYGESYSGALLTKQVSEIMSNFKNVMTGRSSLESTGLRYQYEQLIQYGFTPDQIFSAVMNPGDPSSNSVVNFIINQAVAASNIDTWKNPEASVRARQWAAMGAYSGIGKTEIKDYVDKAGLAEFESALSWNNKQRELMLTHPELFMKNDPLSRFKTSERRFMQGDTAGYEKHLAALEGLRYGEDGIRSSVFGKDGTVNVLAVYEEYNNAIKQAGEDLKNKALSIEERKSTGFGKPVSDEERKWLGDYRKNKDNYISRAKREAGNKVLNKYKVTKVITEDQYNALKAIGYNGKLSGTSFNANFMEPIAKLGTRYSDYSVNLPSYDKVGKNIKGVLESLDYYNQLKGVAHERKADGSSGEKMNLKDIKNDKGEIKDITDIRYSIKNPNEIIVRFEGGREYYISAAVFGDELNDYLTKVAAGIDENSDSDRLLNAALTGTMGIHDRLINWNPLPPTSSKDAVVD